MDCDNFFKLNIFKKATFFMPSIINLHFEPDENYFWFYNEVFVSKKHYSKSKHFLEGSKIRNSKIVRKVSLVLEKSQRFLR